MAAVDPKKVVVVGGGLAGLTAAHELQERGFKVVVYERNDRLGGKARSFPVPNKLAAPLVLCSVIRPWAFLLSRSHALSRVRAFSQMAVPQQARRPEHLLFVGDTLDPSRAR